MSLFLFLLLSCWAEVPTDQPNSDQVIGAPSVEFFSAEFIGSDDNIFDIACDGDGLIYLAYPDVGQVRVFDGENWQVFDVKRTICLATDTRGVVWASQGEGVGYFAKDSLKRLYFQEFEIDFSVDDQPRFHFAFETEFGVRFGSGDTVLEIDTLGDEPKVKLVRANPGETIVAYDGQYVCSMVGDPARPFQIVDGQREEILQSRSIKHRVDCVVHTDDGTPILITDSFTNVKVESNGKLVPFSSEYDELGVDGGLGWILPLPGNRIGLADDSAFRCFNKDGQMLYCVGNGGESDGGIKRFDTFRDGRIWISTGDSFAIVNELKEVGFWPVMAGKDDTSFGLYVCRDRIFIFGESGLFEFPVEETHRFWKRSEYRRLDFQCLSLVEIDDKFIAATAGGVFEFSENDNEKKLTDGLYKMIFHDHLEDGKDILFILDQYSNLDVYEYRPGQVEHIQKIKLQHEGGVKFRLAPNTYLFAYFERNTGSKLIEFRSGLDQQPTIKTISDLGDFFLVKDQLHCLTDSGIRLVEYKQGKLRTIESPFFADVQVGAGVGWVVDCDNRGVAIFDQNDYWHIYPWTGDGKLSSQPDCSFHFGFPFTAFYMKWDSESECLWTIYKGNLIRLDVDSISQSYPPDYPVFIRMNSDELFGPSLGESIPEFKPFGGVSFEFGLPSHLSMSEAKPEYQFKLEGNDDDWSQWSRTVQKEYTNLHGGEFQFRVRARVADGTVKESASSRFSVLNPWYYQIWFKALLALGLVGLVYVASAIRTSNLKAANERMEQLVQQRTREIEAKTKEVLEKSALLNANKIKSEAERLKSFDTLVAGVAHDFNNLLTVISVNNEMIQGEGDNRSKRFAESSTEAIKAAIELCSEMSAFSDKSPASLMPVDVVGAVRTMADTLAQSIPDNIKYVSSLPEESLYSLADIRQLKRALLNLVLNAGEVARSEVKVKVIELELTDDHLINARFVGELLTAGTFHCIEVADDGTGLNENVLNRMFDPFYSTKEFGRGLGLAIVLKIVGRHSGGVIVESSPAGTKFRVCLPKTNKQPARLAKPHMPIRIPGLDILVVDDDRSVLDSVKTLLQSQNHRVLSTDCPKRGVEMVMELQELDLLIVDVAMPEMTGPEMALKVAEVKPDLPILMVSGFNETLLQDELLHRKDLAFLAKPFTTEQFNEKISSLLLQKFSEATGSEI